MRIGPSGPRGPHGPSAPPAGPRPRVHSPWGLKGARLRKERRRGRKESAVSTESFPQARRSPRPCARPVSQAPGPRAAPRTSARGGGVTAGFWPRQPARPRRHRLREGGPGGGTRGRGSSVSRVHARGLLARPVRPGPRSGGGRGGSTGDAGLGALRRGRVAALRPPARPSGVTGRGGADGPDTPREEPRPLPRDPRAPRAPWTLPGRQDHRPQPPGRAWTRAVWARPYVAGGGDRRSGHVQPLPHAGRRCHVPVPRVLAGPH